MNFLQPLILFGLPLIALPIIIHLINQWRYQTKQWSAMMFLLAANQMNRGFARIRRWLILAMRTLAVAGLLFAVARPLSSGFLSLLRLGKNVLSWQPHAMGNLCRWSQLQLLLPLSSILFSPIFPQCPMGPERG